MDHDEARVAALRRLGILDTAPEEQFDAIVHLASLICRTPIAAVSLVDDDRQWFKAQRGLSVVETPRTDSFCTHTIIGRNVFEIRDAAADPRFADGPLVRGDPHVRFYAGAPLVTRDGFAIGTLCVLDREPRRLDDDQHTALLALAGQAMAQIELRQQMVVTEQLEERFRALVEQSSDLIALFDDTATLRYISPSVRVILGYEPDDAALHHLETVIDDADAQAAVLDAFGSAPGSDIKSMEIPLRRKDGSTAYLEVRCTNLLDDPAVEAIVFNARDITEVRRAETDLERARRQALIVLESANDAYMQIDIDGIVTDWNRRATEVFGWEKEEAFGRALRELIVPARYRGQDLGALFGVASGSDPRSETLVENLEVMAAHRDGSEFPVEVTLWSTDTEEEGLRFSTFVRDVTERRALEDRLAHEALHDDLTGLPNRHLLRDRLEIALARCVRDRRKVGVLFLDLDRFKVVNDGSGHSVGDDLLVQVARRLEAEVRATDTVVRFGGDEFVVVVDGVDDSIEVAELAERIRVSLAEPAEVDGSEVPTSASIGYVVTDGDIAPERLVSDADAAMYVAKQRGRNRAEAFGAELHARARARLDDERALRRALEDDELRLEYQPIISLADGSIIGAEALVRWERPGHGLLPPAAFIPLAEETGLIVAVGTWVLGEACAQLRAWQDSHPRHRLGMAVNVTARQISNGDLDTAVAAILERSGVEPGSVTLELTESTLMEDLDLSASTLTELRSIGVRIAIDDFGTGYSSLGYLKALPIDILKVDRSFVMNLGTNPYDSAIVTAISTIAGSLGLQVVAEGVETAEQVALVRDHGCDAAQGFHFARPMSADAFADLLEARP
ncbi:MAG: sensor domain-containing phosphodiesterase [Acidimicrobiales bacterium]